MSDRDHKYVMAVLAEARMKSPDREFQAHYLDDVLRKQHVARAAFARWIIDKQVPLKGTVE